MTTDLWFRKTQPTPSPVYDAYWSFAAKRQEILHKRVNGAPRPWTDDTVLAEYRFTNAYRAADRVSQYLIREVAYTGEQDPREVVFRVLLFKLFNRIGTWELLTSQCGQLTRAEFSVDDYNCVLNEAFAAGNRLYSSAYIMPPAYQGRERKHTTHLQLVDQMLGEELPEKLAEAPSMSSAFERLIAYRGVGSFLAYQLVTDVNYTRATNFSEMEFVKAGPGARSGLEKCFTDPGDYDAEDLIRWTADRQEEEFSHRGLAFQDLWGRRLQLIDCQNLYCEIDKYARVAYRGVTSSSRRKRIKQKYSPDSRPLKLWFPPKWGLNERLPASASVDKFDSSLHQVNGNPASTCISDTAEDLIACQDRLFPVV